MKFIVLHDTYVEQEVSGRRQLVGSDVNLIHRLAKTMLASIRAGRPMRCEHLGEIETLSMDLHPRYAELAQQQRVVVSPEEAHYFSDEYPVPPAVLWDALNDPQKRNQYMVDPGQTLVPATRPGGRTGIGARNHCLHGKNVGMVEEILDWKPFEYFTVRMPIGPFTVLETLRLVPSPDRRRTVLIVSAKGKTPFPGPLNRTAFKLIAGRASPLSLRA